jgi:hydroxymethylglutaryl-CoA lyase
MTDSPAIEVDRHVRVYEVGPRDGLQNEATAVPTEAKVRFVELLVAAGLREIEAASFVHSRAIPQLTDAEAVLPALPDVTGVRYPVLVANLRGLTRAEAAGAEALTVATATTDTFTEHTMGMTVADSLDAFAPVLERAGDLGWWRRAHISTVFGCPYTGRVDPARGLELALELFELGADEVSFGDTIGVAVPAQVTELTGRAVEAGLHLDRLAFHFHDTRGTALANVSAGLAAGIRCFDGSTGGAGGCPYSPGAAGNLATEDLVYLLDTEGWQHGVKLAPLLEAARFIASAVGRPLASGVGRAGGWDPSSGGSTGLA